MAFGNTEPGVRAKMFGLVEREPPDSPTYSDHRPDLAADGGVGPGGGGGKGVADLKLFSAAAYDAHVHRARRIPRYAFGNREQEEEMPQLTDAQLKAALNAVGEGLVKEVKEEVRTELKEMKELEEEHDLAQQLLK